MSTINKHLLAKDVMIDHSKFATVREKVILKETIDLMCQSKLGIACVIDRQNILIGVLTDGDIRRILLSTQKPLSALFVDDTLDHASTEFTSISEKTSLIDAIEIMGKLQIWDLPVLDSIGTLKGLLHLHPAISYLLEIYSK